MTRNGDLIKWSKNRKLTNAHKILKDPDNDHHILGAKEQSHAHSSFVEIKKSESGSVTAVTGKHSTTHKPGDSSVIEPKTLVKPPQETLNYRTCPQSRQLQPLRAGELGERHILWT